MPDISMCNSDSCELAKLCYRNPRSGTVPSERRQAWFVAIPPKWDGECNWFWRVDS